LDQRLAFIKSLDQGKIDFQFLTYSGALHAFMNPEADKFHLEGIGYNAVVAQRAWNQMQLFFQEIFGTERPPRPHILQGSDVHESPGTNSDRRRTDYSRQLRIPVTQRANSGAAARSNRKRSGGKLAPAENERYAVYVRGTWRRYFDGQHYLRWSFALRIKQSCSFGAFESRMLPMQRRSLTFLTKPPGTGGQWTGYSGAIEPNAAPFPGFTTTPPARGFFGSRSPI